MNDVGRLAVANGLVLVLGAGLLPLLRLAGTRRELLVRLPLAYAVGLAATGILAATLALVGLAVGPLTLTLLAAAALALGLRRAGPGAATRPGRPTGVRVAAFVVLGLALAYLVQAARLAAVKPLVENDGWALWGMRARALYEFGRPATPVFTESPYPALQYPLLLPSLEAVSFRFTGGFDGTLLHLQLVALAFAFVAGGWVLLRPYAPPLLLAASLLAIVTAPAFLGQLETNSADVPLGMFLALGLAALAAWLRTGASGLLSAATLFLAAGALTKNEGELFVLAAFLAALAVSRPAQRRPVLLAAAVAVALLLPWRLWLLAHGVTSTTFSLSNLLDPRYLVDHSDRLSSAVEQLAEQLFLVSAWGYLTVFALAGVGLAFAAGRTRPAAFAGLWLVLAFAGLLGVYWASELPLHPNLYYSSDRTIVSIVLGGALLVPVLVGPGERAPD